MTKALTREMINGYNKMVEAARGTCFYGDYVLGREDITSNGRFKFFIFTSLRSNYEELEGEKWYIKTVHGITYIYWEWRLDKMRWIISETDTNARRYFGI